MRVLVIGSTGRLGSALVASLLSHAHQPIALSRSATDSSFITIRGSAEDVGLVKAAILEHDVDALICCAGSPAPAVQPSGGERISARQGFISEAVARAAVEAGKERGRPVRGWWVSGFGLLDAPGRTDGMVPLDLAPTFRPEHRLTHSALLATPTADLKWSILCPSLMTPRGDRPAHTLRLNATHIPIPVFLWQMTMLLSTAIRVLLVPERYRFVALAPLALWLKVRLDDVADALVADLQSGSDAWIGKKVGICE